MQNNISLNFETVTHDKLPEFNNEKVDVLFCFEVLEHVPSPVAVINNIKACMKPGSVYIENFIKHSVKEGEDEDGPDLLSARNEREDYFDILNEYFNLLHPNKEMPEVNPKYN